jgi:hypothetical protein
MGKSGGLAEAPASEVRAKLVSTCQLTGAIPQAREREEPRRASERQQHASAASNPKRQQHARHHERRKHHLRHQTSGSASEGAQATHKQREQREADERAAHDTHALPNKRASGVRESANHMPAAQGARGADNACDAGKRRRQHMGHQRSKANSTASERAASDGG